MVVTPFGRGAAYVTASAWKLLRSLATTPRLVVLVLTGLVVSFGALLAVASMAAGLFDRGLPYPNADKIVRLAETVGRDPENRVTVSWLNADEWRRSASDLYEHYTVVRNFQTVVLETEAGAQALNANFVESSYADVFGFNPVVGRFFSPEETRPEAGADVAVVSHGLWERAFGRSPSVVGSSITLDGRSFTVVGIADSTFVDVSGAFFPPEVWLPLGTSILPVPVGFLDNRSGRYFRVYATLADPHTPESAITRLEGLAGEMEERYPDSNRDFGIGVLPLREQLFGDLRLPLAALAGACVFLALVTLANTFSLLTSRALRGGRARSIRRALGASRADLARTGTLEGVALGITASVGAVVLADMLMRVFRASNPLSLPPFVETGLDESTSVLIAAGVVVSVTAVSAVTSWVAPAGPILGSESAGSTGRTSRTQSTVAFLQLTVATAIVAVAFIMGRSLATLQNDPIGLDVDDRTAVTIQLPSTRYPLAEDQKRFARLLNEQLSSRDGVGPLALWAPSVPGFSGNRTTLVREGEVVASQSEAFITRYHNISPWALEAMGIQLRSGRGITSQDGDSDPPVAVVSESLAHALWPGESPIGKQVRNFVPVGSPYGGERNPWAEIVGVASDAKHSGRTNEVVPAPFDIYYPLQQRYRSLSTVTVILHNSPRFDAAELVREAVSGIDPALPVQDVSSLSEIVNAEFSIPRLTTGVMLGVSGLAMMIGMIGLLGVVSEGVSRRTKELALRRAVGARPLNLVGLLLRPEILRTGAAIACGLTLASTVGSLVEPLLYRTPPIDTLTYGATAALVVLVSIGSIIRPVAQAARTDPIRALRE